MPHRAMWGSGPLSPYVPRPMSLLRTLGLGIWNSTSGELKRRPVAAVASTDGCTLKVQVGDELDMTKARSST